MCKIKVLEENPCIQSIKNRTGEHGEVNQRDVAKLKQKF